MGDKGGTKCLIWRISAFFTTFASMRAIFHILAVIAVILSLEGCGKGGHRPVTDTGWTAVTPGFDSTVSRLELSYIHPTPSHARDSLMKSLDSLPVPEARAQRLYWTARLAHGDGDDDRALLLVDSGLNAIDSAAYPYEWARLISIKAALPNIPVKTAYELSVNNLRYFEERGDSFMLGATLMRLGTVMWSINDTLPAAAYYRRADTIYRHRGPEEYWLRNLVNIANTLGGPETDQTRDSLMMFLRSSPVTRADSGLYFNILRNSYFNTGDLGYLMEAYAYACADPTRPATRAGVEATIADHFLSHDSPADSIKKYARLAFRDIDKVTDNLTRALIYNAMAYTAYSEGETDRTIALYNEYIAARLAMEQERFSLEITKAEYRQSFDKATREAQMRHRQEREIWLTALILACALAVAIWVVFYFRVANARVNRQRAELQLLQNSNYLSACALAIDEKDRIIESLVKTVDKMQSDGKIAPPEARELTANVRRSLSNTLERETFTQLHKKLHPEFIHRLKKDYPMLTESQLRHAAYIAMGLSSKQIAQVLNIEYESVKKSRTRLRNRMALPPEASLEDTLRGYTSLN